MIEEFDYRDTWFKPVFLSQDESWQVAILNHDPRQELSALDKLERHCETDEVFILDRGLAVLIEADTSVSPYFFHCIKLEQGKVYNVPRKVWHNIAMWEDSSLYIVERGNTDKNDVEYIPLKDVHKLEKTVSRLLKGNLS